MKFQLWTKHVKQNNLNESNFELFLRKTNLKFYNISEWKMSLSDSIKFKLYVEPANQLPST